MVGETCRQRQSVDANSVRACEWVVADIKGFYAAFKRVERRRDILRPMDFRCDCFQAERARRCLGLIAYPVRPRDFRYWP